MKSRHLLEAGLAALLTLPLASTAQDYGTVGTKPGAAAGGAGDPASVVGIELGQNRAAAAAQEYWTPERMRNAEPMSIILEGEPSPQRLQAQPTASPMVRVPGAPPSLETDAPPVILMEPDLDQQDKQLSTGGEQDPLAASGDRPYPFTGSQVYDSYEQYPLRTTGKLFFTLSGRDFVCSATALVSNNQRLVWTAGHCVAEGDGRTWATNVRFVPAYRDGAAPFGTWAACGVYTTNAWFQSGDFSQDFGAIKTCDRNDGARIQQVVGAVGFMANVPRIQHWNAFGYPASQPFNGQTLHTCQAAHGQDDDSVNPMSIGIGCDMNGGSSGGPWIVDFVRQGPTGNYLNGVNSYSYRDKPNVLFSPYAGDAFLSLRNFAISKGA